MEDWRIVVKKLEAGENAKESEFYSLNLGRQKVLIYELYDTHRYFHKNTLIVLIGEESRGKAPLQFGVSLISADDCMYF